MTKQRSNFSDSEVLAGLRDSPETRKVMLQFLYDHYFDSVCAMIMTNGGQEDDAHDVFQDAVIAFYEKVKQHGFAPQARIQTYLYTVARYKWIDRLRKRKQEHLYKERLPIAPLDDYTPEIKVLDNEKRTLLANIMDQLGPDCRKVLQLAIYEETPMKEISRLMGYKTEQVARNKKNKCLNQLRKFVASSPFFASFFQSEP